MRKALFGLFMLILLALLAGCDREIGIVQKAGAEGDIEAGRDAIVHYGCGACHVIPGIPNANAYVGPPLNE